MLHCQRIRATSRSVLHYIVNLNLFPSIPPTTDPYKLKSQRISTYLYIILTLCSLLILLVYTSTATINQTITINQPTLLTYTKLFETHSQTLTCPCTNTSVQHGKFLRIEFLLHQLCYSSLITESWMNNITVKELNFNTGNKDEERSRRSIISIFQALRSLCERANKTTTDDIFRFESSQYISTHLVPDTILQSQSESIIGQYRSSMAEDFLSSLHLIRRIMEANNYFSYLETNTRFYVKPPDPNYKRHAMKYDECDCDTTASCTTSFKIYKSRSSEISHVIPGLRIGCYIFEAVLKSDLRCFYNLACLNQLTPYISLSMVLNPPLLNASLPSLFHPNTMIDNILENLMIEQWNFSMNYENYFNGCYPAECSYIEKTRNNIFYIVTTVIGLIGGLIQVLQSIVPRIIAVVRRKNTGERQNNALGNQRRFQFFTQVWQKLRNLNLFATVPPSTDRFKLINQKLATYVFIASFIVSLSIILMYLSASTVTKTLTMKQPTLVEYEELYKKHFQTLVCPCSNTTVEYEKFLHINYTLHQVCSSSFVKQSWIDFVAQYGKNIDVRGFDFRIIGPLMFRALRSLCEQINITMTNGITNFYHTKYVSTDLTAIKLFESRIESDFTELQVLTTKELLASLSPMREISQSNDLISSIQTNAYLYLLPDTDEVVVFGANYRGCGCAFNSNCAFPARMNTTGNSSTDTILYYIDGMRTGCYAFESLLQSNLQCFYSRTCFNEFIFYLSKTQSFNGSILDSSLPSRFHINSTINELLQKIMVENWTLSKSYEDYYKQCHSKECTYIDRVKNDATYIVTTVIGLVGGLITALRFIALRAINLIRRNKPPVSAETGEVQNHPTLSAYTVKFWKWVRNLNLFVSSPPATDQFKIKSQIISTYIFIAALACSFSTLLIYSSAVPTTKVITAVEPSLKEYLELYTEHKKTLSCRCKTISIEYSMFMKIDYTLHAVCTNSTYINNWFTYLMRSSVGSPYHPADFRFFGISAVKSLQSLCQQLNNTIVNNIIRFDRNQFVNIDLVSYELFESRTKSFFEEFQSSTTAEYLSSLHIIREMTHNNHLHPTTLMNSLLNAASYTNFAVIVLTEYPDGCSCFLTPHCIDPGIIFEGLTMQILYRIAGLYNGCYTLDALLASNLNCLFYNRTCFDEIVFFLHSPWPYNQTVIDSSVPSRFYPNSTVFELLHHLMVEEWNWSSSYEKYFNQCHPTECAYIIRKRNDPIYIVTTVISLLGGLSSVFKLVIPHLVHFVRYLWKRRRMVAVGVDNT